MIKNFFKIAWRALWKNKAFTIINITGLATGLACFILITLYVSDELSFDKHFKDGDDIYRVNSDIRFGGTDLKLAVCSDPMGSTLKKDYPNVEEFTRVYASSGSKLVKKENSFITETKVAHVDSTFFSVFQLPAIEGNTTTALNEPNTVVITASTAKKYFNSLNVLGKTIEANRTPYKITAVIEDIPTNTHFNFDMIFSMKNVDYQMGNFLSHNFHTYIKLKKNTDPKVFEKNFDQVINTYVIPQARMSMNINSMDDFKKAGNNLVYSLISVKDIHLKSDRFPELSATGNIQYVYIFSAVAIFILVLACINFMNLSTARSANRAREVGIRKVLGTNRASLIKQFLSESIFLVIISTIIALGITALVLPLFNDIAAKSIEYSSIFTGNMLPVLILLPFIVGGLAGVYPAFFLSSFKPVAVLKGNLSGASKKSVLRNGLVVFQFATSIILMVGTLVVFKQLNYIQNKQLGFNKDQILLVSGVNELRENKNPFKNEVMSLSGVKNGTISSFLPVSFSSRSDRTYSTEATMTTSNSFNMQSWGVDYDYIETLGMEIVKGRNFSRDFGSDSLSIIINETTAKMMGTGDPIGKKLYINTDQGSPLTPLTVVGVVKDFHYESMRQGIAPMVMTLSFNGWIACFKVNTTDIQSLVKQVEQKWKSIAPNLPFSYQFMDDAFDNMYRTEQRIGKIALSFAVIAILIACLGLFGLATYMAERRVKEIGIRKVLGATVLNITSMLSTDFLKLVLVAALIAFPVAWFAMNSWLEDFAYRINISVWIFIIAGVMSIIIALATVSFQAIKAALRNPVKSLRTE